MIQRVGEAGSLIVLCRFSAVVPGWRVPGVAMLGSRSPGL